MLGRLSTHAPCPLSTLFSRPSIIARLVTVRTLADSKLGGDHYRGLASLELYRGSLLQITAQLQKILFY
ncbi:hypothetical protein GW17_00003673 [Ensete ventricosum]|nr:hypothetical protein GW17_00003673 [Ensete ventricosum]